MLTFTNNQRTNTLLLNKTTAGDSTSGLLHEPNPNAQAETVITMFVWTHAVSINVPFPKCLVKSSEQDGHLDV